MLPGREAGGEFGQEVCDREVVVLVAGQGGGVVRVGEAFLIVFFLRELFGIL